MKKSLLFDLDGTIVDSKKGIINSILYSLNKMNILEENPIELERFIGPPLRASYMKRYGLNTAEGNEMVATYREYYSNRGVFENEVYEGVEEVFKQLVSKSYSIYLATSKPTFYAEQILKQHRIDGYFEGVVGSNMDNTRTDKTEIISFIKSTYSIQSETALMIGDRKYDLVGAKNNGLYAAGVTYGYGTYNELKAENPAFIANDRDELLTGIESWLQRI